MNWLIDIFTQQTFVQAIIVITLVCATGVALGEIRIWGISLGVTFVFFAGIIAGHFGLTVDPQMLAFAQNFGLVLFIYSLGVQVGPGFFSAFKRGGVKLNSLAISVLLIGTFVALAISLCFDMPISTVMGLFSGAVTNTPMLGAAQQTLLQIHPEATAEANNMAVACAVGYPLGVVGVIICTVILKAVFSRKIAEKHINGGADSVYIGEYQICNPSISGKSIKEIMAPLGRKFVITRVWRNGKVRIPTSDTILEENDHILAISTKADVDLMNTIFGHKENTDWNKKDIDWDAIDEHVVSRHILVTKKSLNGVKLGSLHLRNTYGINITRINRAGIDLLATPSLRLQMGDKLTIVGDHSHIDEVAKILGNEAKQLNTPNLFSIFTGLLLGLIVGSIPFIIPGISTPVKLGIAGGPIIVGLLMGAFGPRIHILTYTTRSANMMLRQLGITLYLAGLGLSAGPGFFATVFTSQGLLWISLSMIMTMLPVLLVGYAAGKFFKVDFGNNIGMLCGSMANPMALNYANSLTDDDNPSVSYATVYPVCIFLRVIIAQIIMLILC